jgi:hypothetical protein
LPHARIALIVDANGAVLVTEFNRRPACRIDQYEPVAKRKQKVLWVAH